MPGDFSGTIAGNRHYPTGSKEDLYRIVVFRWTGFSSKRRDKSLTDELVHFFEEVGVGPKSCEHLQHALVSPQDQLFEETLAWQGEKGGTQGKHSRTRAMILSVLQYLKPFLAYALNHVW